MYYTPPTAGEHFYLRLLLTAVKGPTSYEHLRTFQGNVAPSFREACLAWGILENDQEWQQCLEEAKSMATGHQLRQLFVTILHDCAPSDPVLLWNTYWPHICDDLRYQLQYNNIHINPTDDDVQDYGLYLIDHLLLASGKSLSKDWPYMPQVTQNWEADLGNCLTAEQHRYDMEEQAVLAAEHEDRFNADQKPMSTTPSAIAFILRARSLFVLHPLALQLFCSKAAVLPIPASTFLSTSTRLPPVQSQGVHTLLIC